MLYLDHNATTQPTPAVVQAVNTSITQHWANPSSAHRAGQNAKHSIETARTHLAALLGIKPPPRGLVFTGTGSEAIAMAISGSMAAMKAAEKRTIITSTVEHSAVTQLCEQLASTTDINLVTIPVNHDGLLDLQALKAALQSDPENHAKLVSVQWVNNETGVIQSVAEIGALCREHKALFHCDATQWIGKMATTLEADPEPDPSAGGLIDILTGSPHKFHGIKGVGFLWARAGARMIPMIPGSQELGRRGGTESVPAIAAAGQAALEAKQWIDESPDDQSRLAGLRDHLERTIIQRCAPFLKEPIVVNGSGAPRIWSTTNIGFPQLQSEALLLTMSERGLCVSGGSACASGSLEPSDVLVAMGIDDRIGRGSIRMSISRFTTQEEIDQAIEIVVKSVEIVSRSIV